MLDSVPSTRPRDAAIKPEYVQYEWAGWSVKLKPFHAINAHRNQDVWVEIDEKDSIDVKCDFFQFTLVMLMAVM
jgi:hypothetical protein